MAIPTHLRVSSGAFQPGSTPLRTNLRPHGAPIWIKRDDETGSDFSGNKIRKLEFLLAEALERRCDVVITCGGIQSNHCRATAVAARRIGLDSVLFLRGDAPSQADGNILIDLLVGARPLFITPEQYARRARSCRKRPADWKHRAAART